MTHTFTPPTVHIVPTILPDTKGQAFALFRHYDQGHRGVTVFVLSDNTVVTDYPVDIAGDEKSTVAVPDPKFPMDMGMNAQSANTGGEIPYPLSQWGGGVNGAGVEGSPPYTWVYDVLQSPSVSSYSTSPYMVTFFRGGITYTISTGMFNLLTTAGFGAYCT